MFTLDPIQLTILVSVFIPLVVGIITKSAASPQVKTIANIIVTAAVSLIANAMNDVGEAVFSSEMLTNCVLGLVISISTYYGVYKPVEIPGKLAPNKGIG